MRNIFFKSNKILLSFLLMVFVIQFTQSQQTNNDYRLLLKSGTVDLNENLNSFINEGSLNSFDTYKNKHYCFLQFNKIPSQIEKALIEASGIELLDYIPNYAYIASVPFGYNTELLRNYNVRNITRIQGIHKTANSLLAPPYPDWAVNDDGTVDIVAKYYKNIDPASVKSMVNEAGIQIISSYDYSQLLTLRIKPEDVDKVANFAFIMYLDAIPHPPVPDDTEARSLHRVNAVNSAYPAGRHYDGTGVVCAIADDGAIGPHIDYTGRVTQHTIGYGNTHGDMTSGILMGCGNLDPTIVGSAPGAYLQLYSIPHMKKLH